MLAFPAPYYCLISILITTQSQSDYSHHAATVRQDGRGKKQHSCVYIYCTCKSLLCTGLLLCHQLCLSRGICLGLPL